MMERESRVLIFNVIINVVTEVRCVRISSFELLWIGAACLTKKDYKILKL